MRIFHGSAILADENFCESRGGRADEINTCIGCNQLVWIVFRETGYLFGESERVTKRN